MAEKREKTPKNSKERQKYQIMPKIVENVIKNLSLLQDIPNGAAMPHHHPPMPPTSAAGGPGSGPLPPMMNGGGPISHNVERLPSMNGGSFNGGPPGGMMGGPPSGLGGPSGNMAPLPPMSSGSLPSMVS